MKRLKAICMSQQESRNWINKIIKNHLQEEQYNQTKYLPVVIMTINKEPVMFHHNKEIL